MKKDWYLSPAQAIDTTAADGAKIRQAQLTKPQGSLGELEELAIKFAGWQGNVIPQCKKVLVRVFAGDHGICKDRVDDDGVKLANVSTQEPAMSEGVLLQALQAGREQVVDQHVDLFIGGEMGIGNTTSAAAIYSLLMKVGPEATVGGGTGVDKAGIAIKRKVIYQAINRHGELLETPLNILQHVGGLEIAALVGAIIAAAQRGTPVLVDGFICTAAALLAIKVNPSVRQWLLFSHKSAEKAHAKALIELEARPLLDLNMRLGEGSGSGVAVSLIQSALALHAQMATFEEASISTKKN